MMLQSLVVSSQASDKRGIWVKRVSVNKKAGDQMQKEQLAVTENRRSYSGDPGVGSGQPSSESHVSGIG